VASGAADPGEELPGAGVFEHREPV